MIKRRLRVYYNAVSIVSFYLSGAAIIYIILSTTNYIFEYKKGILESIHLSIAEVGYITFNIFIPTQFIIFLAVVILMRPTKKKRR